MWIFTFFVWVPHSNLNIFAHHPRKPWQRTSCLLPFLEKQGLPELSHLSMVAFKDLATMSVGEMIKLLAVTAYCHFAVTLLCLNVLFDLTIFGAPLFALRKLQLLSSTTFLRCSTFLINWTTPIVFAMPMIFSGTVLYCNDTDLLVEAKASESSLLLSNHGSRIDWMVGMLSMFRISRMI